MIYKMNRLEDDVLNGQLVNRNASLLALTLHSAHSQVSPGLI